MTNFSKTTDFADDKISSGEKVGAYIISGDDTLLCVKIIYLLQINT